MNQNINQNINNKNIKQNTCFENFFPKYTENIKTLIGQETISNFFDNLHFQQKDNIRFFDGTTPFYTDVLKARLMLQTSGYILSDIDGLNYCLVKPRCMRIDDVSCMIYNLTRNYDGYNNIRIKNESKDGTIKAVYISTLGNTLVSQKNSTDKKMDEFVLLKNEPIFCRLCPFTQLYLVVEFEGNIKPEILIDTWTLDTDLVNKIISKENIYSNTYNFIYTQGEIPNEDILLEKLRKPTEFSEIEKHISRSFTISAEIIEDIYVFDYYGEAMISDIKCNENITIYMNGVPYFKEKFLCSPYNIFDARTIQSSSSNISFTVNIIEHEFAKTIVNNSGKITEKPVNINLTDLSI